MFSSSDDSGLTNRATHATVLAVKCEDATPSQPSSHSHDEELCGCKNVQAGWNVKLSGSMHQDSGNVNPELPGRLLHYPNRVVQHRSNKQSFVWRYPNLQARSKASLYGGSVCVPVTG